MDSIRIGYVSSVDEGTGMVRVTYPDRDRAVTAEVPYFSHNREYLMPQVNDMVVVAHISNDPSMAVVLGAFWNREDPPPVSVAGGFYKPMSQDGSCSMRQDNGRVTITDRDGTVSMEDVLDLKRRVERLEAGGGDG